MRPGAPATDTAAAFLAAIEDGDAQTVWECFSTSARRFVVERGVRRGLSPEAGASILDGTATEHFHRQFIEDVLAGLRKDLELVRIPLVEVAPPSPLDDHRVRVVYLERFDVPVGPPLEPLPVGSIDLVSEDGVWRVERLIPRPGG